MRSTDLVAHSYKSPIWEVEADAKSHSVWLEHRALATNADPFHWVPQYSPGVNGIKLHGGYFYASSTQHPLHFRPGGQTEAKQWRLEHYKLLRKVKGVIVEGGPLLGPDGFPTNMLIVVDGKNDKALKSFIESEYAKEMSLRRK